MASSKKKQDEKHLKILREMVALAHNKQCFDCHQRGPTYINMTIGSYVCTACSGLLRGLNPPHRVKSISMASFTPEEMDFIKCHGNEFCRKVWLGLYDNRLGNQSESREENKVKDFMVQKYERKRYYVAPTEAMKEEAKKMNESIISKAPGTRPLKSLLGDNTPKLQVGNHQEDQNNSTVAESVEKQEDLFGSESLSQQGGDRFSPTSSTTQQPTDNLFAPTTSGPLSAGNTLFGQTNDDLNQLSSGSNIFAYDSGTYANDMFGLATGIPQNPLGTQPDPIPQQTLGFNQLSFNVQGQNTTSDGQTSILTDLFTIQAVQGHVQGQHDTIGSQGNKSDTNPFEGIQGNIQVQGNLYNQGLFGTQSSQVLTASIVKEPKPVSATPPPIRSTPQSPGNQSVQSSKSSGSTAMDLLGDLGGDPFASSAPQAQPATGGFADFGNFGNTGNQSAAFPPVAQQTSQPPPFAQSTPLQPFGSSSSSSTSTSQTVNGNVAPSVGGDKYSNLSDLFSSATTTETDTSVGAGWSLSSTSSGGGGINWNTSGSSTSTGGINWGGDSSTNTGTAGINWNSSSSQSSSNTSAGWGGAGSTSNAASTGMSGMSWGAPSTVQSNGLGAPGNPFLQQSSVANPFGGGVGTSLSTQTSMAGASNPFGGQPAVAQPGGFGVYGSQAGGFGQFGAQQNTAVNSTPGQFGQFGGMQNGGFGAMTSTGGFGNVYTSTQAGFRQPGQQQFAGQPGFGQQQQAAAGFGAMSQGGFGAQPAQGFGQPVGSFGAQPQQQMQGFPAQGGWGQAPASSSANPFMSTAQQYSAQPKSGTTNPFL